METAVSSYIAVGSGFSGAPSGARSNPGESQGNRSSVEWSYTSQSDRVELSPEAREISQTADENNEKQETPAANANPNTSPTEELSQEEYLKLTNLKTRDREVRTHEQAHLAAAGQYAAGGASFTFQVGPDGNRYAVSGEVPVDISSGASPQETIRKMERIRAAALAPAQPSAADRQIAAQASMKASQARQEIMMSRQSDLLANDLVDTDPAEDEGVHVEDPLAGAVGPRPSGISPGGVLISVMIRAYRDMQAQDQRSA
ncbi:putative metalloprotease CJM1_0395 family protein [Desulfopila aestuarii]|uniref:SprA-related family protein n=1 Tax=Desulfopila aestuarii DSM 18488 TaxID=1121416 RepID=A0A1M7Y162_9BACT|nr:putative metalloprotease CJM1_0395 family protein [Desulfopila aestuarii]SHO45475.1 SprA-related family protein [Desulfopila aestuarii DSM 18488]